MAALCRIRRRTPKGLEPWSLQLKLGAAKLGQVEMLPYSPRAKLLLLLLLLLMSKLCRFTADNQGPIMPFRLSQAVCFVASLPIQETSPHNM